MKRFRRLLLPVLMLIVTACSNPSEIAFDADMPAPSAAMQGQLTWQRPEMVQDLSASLGTATGEYELATGQVLFDGTLTSSKGYAVSFWAVKGEDRYIKIALEKLPVIQFDVPAEALAARPDGSAIAKGDSVLITVEIDETDLAVHMSPSGLQFTQKAPAVMSMWYDQANGDFNADGVVNKYDWYIEQNMLGVWYQQTEYDAWSAIASERLASDQRVTAPIYHFSRYAVSW